MLDDTNQKRLAETIPVGMQETSLHLWYRQEIKEQQQKLEKIAKKSVIVKKREINRDIFQNKFDILQVKRWGVSKHKDNYQFLKMNPRLEKLIIIVVPLDYSAMISAPSLTSATEILRSYHRGGELVVAITTWLRQMGYLVQPHHPMGNLEEYHQLLLPPHAVEAGLGEKGRTGLFIDYKYGPLVQLVAVSTNAPISVTRSEPKGITEFCHRCQYCVSYCPTKALPEGTYLEQVVSGISMEFKINANRCFKYFEAHQGCGRCITHCILAEPDVEKISLRLKRISNWYQKWIVSGKLEEMYLHELQ